MKRRIRREKQKATDDDDCKDPNQNAHFQLLGIAKNQKLKANDDYRNQSAEGMCKDEDSWSTCTNPCTTQIDFDEYCQ